MWRWCRLVGVLLMVGRCAAGVSWSRMAMKKGRLPPPLFLLSGLAPSLRLPMLPKEGMQDCSCHQGQKGNHRVSHLSRSAFISSLMYLPLLGCWFSHGAFSLSSRNDMVFWLLEPWAAYALRTRSSSSFFCGIVVCLIVEHVILLAYRPHGCRCHVQVFLRCLDMLMSECRAYGADVGAHVGSVRGECMSYRVWR